MSGLFALDRQTLYLVFSASGIALSVIFLSLRTVAPSYKGLTRWTFADALIGSAFLLLAFKGGHALVHGVLANTLILAGTACLSNGTWAFLRRPKRLEPLAYLPPIAAAPLLTYFTFAHPEPRVRASIMTLTLTVQFAATAAVLLYRFPFKRNKPAYYSAAVFIILAAWFLYAASAVPLGPWTYPVSLLVIGVGMVAWTLGMGVMTAMRLAEELEAHEAQAGKLRQATLVQNIIDNMPVSIVLKDTRSRFISCNAAFARSVGKSPEELTGLSDRDLYPADFAATYIAQDAEVMASGRGKEVVERYSIDGAETWIETMKTPVYDHEGNCEGVLVAFRDITRRKTAEEKLQESERLYRELSEHLETRVRERTEDLERAKRESDLFFDVSPEYLCVADFSGRFLKLSQSWTKNFGWGEPELMDRSFLDFIHREDRLSTLEAVRALVSGGRIQDRANRFQRSDGSWVWLSWNAVGIPEQGIVLAAAHDITARVETEESLRSARETAEAANQAKSQFISTMSHELRTPLNAVLGYARLLAPLTSGERSERYIKSIESSGSALLAIINDLLDLTKAESGRLELTPAPFDPRLLMDEIAEIFRFGAEEKGLYLEFKASGRLPKTILLDAPRLRQVLINLIGNSIKFTDRGSVRVSFDASLPPEAADADAHTMYLTKLSILVEDTGIGMSEKYRARLFEPFSQQDASISRRFGGTGLGLAIAKRLLDLMGGIISCDSEANKGTRFTIEIPNVRAAGSALEVVSFIGGGKSGSGDAAEPQEEARPEIPEEFDPKRARDALEAKNAEFAETKRSLERKNAELEALVAKLSRLSMSDELTGLANRRSVSARLSAEVARAKRSGRTLAVLMGDLDRFKLVNDKLGHQAGDAVLAESARRFSSALRASDTLGRWGGEEFLAVLPETDLENAMAAGERARERIGNAPIAYGTELVRATISIGAAIASPTPEDDAERCASALIRAADDALYRAKAKGRNRVEGMPSRRGEPPAEEAER